MMTKNLQRKIKNTGLVLSLALGFLMMFGITANAQYRNDDNYRRDRERERREEQRERQEQQHQNRNNGYYGNNGGYDRNDDGYNRNNGGYNRNDGYYGNDGGYGNGGYNNNLYRIAQQNGYNDGLRKGAEDARERHSNPTGTSEYRRATNGYNSSYGNKEGYKQAYRQAFLQGFDEAQRGYYNNGRYGNRNRTYNNGAGSIFRRIITGY